MSLILPSQVVLPAVPSCVRAIPGWKKVYFAAAEQHPVIQGGIDEAGLWTRSSETFFAAHEQRELYQQLGNYMPRKHEEQNAKPGKEAKEKGVPGLSCCQGPVRGGGKLRCLFWHNQHPWRSAEHLPPPKIFTKLAGQPLLKYTP